MHIKVIGRGQPLVLLHGWAMHSGIFETLTDELAKDFECWLVDLPGHGSSADTEGLERVVVAENLLRRLPPALWLGWSLGGLIALEAALMAPDRVIGLIEIASSPRFVVATDWPHAVEATVFARFGTDLARDYPGTIERFLLLAVNGDDHARRELRWLRERLAQRALCSKSALEDGLRILGDTDLRTRLSTLTSPSLWIAGQRDRLVPQAAMQSAATAAGGEFLRIDRAGHLPFLSQPARVALAVREFARRSQVSSPDGECYPPLSVR